MEENTNEQAAVVDITGQVMEGKVTGITSFGAFIKLDNGEDGLVHISEIADTYVKSVGDFVSLGDAVKVKVLGKNKKGKHDLSLKQVEGNKLEAKPNSGHSSPAEYQAPAANYAKKPRPIPNTFEDKVDQFLKRSEEKSLDVRRNIQGKQGIKKRKKKG